MTIGLSRFNLESFSSFRFHLVSLPPLLPCLARFLLPKVGKCAKVDFSCFHSRLYLASKYIFRTCRQYIA
ncbi:hypothetical protein RchiOBHm_Chr7g0195241 [Rosa chinensis]|uniref:Uncharacterized protein n=1 Tax=Rosa chinensis TaxID=74649 RepID=A0A2P6P6B4_ROSCH|nr:hypothetical protein RchiOBHm_Chr7g0195241 [Rosa chinensis]